MRLITDDLWNINYSARSQTVIVVTTNSTVTRYGKLVMGRGAAKEMRDKFNGIDSIAGTVIKQISQLNDQSLYGFVPLNTFAIYGYWLGIFQVKYRYDADANLDLILYSALALKQYAQKSNLMTFRLNYPGIGNGGLDAARVYPIIHNYLPDNVVVCQYAA